MDQTRTDNGNEETKICILVNPPLLCGVLCLRYILWQEMWNLIRYPDARWPSHCIALEKLVLQRNKTKREKYSFGKYSFGKYQMAKHVVQRNNAQTCHHLNLMWTWQICAHWTPTNRNVTVCFLFSKSFEISATFIILCWNCTLFDHLDVSLWSGDEIWINSYISFHTPLICQIWEKLYYPFLQFCL